MIITTKLKAVRSKFRSAIDSGKKSGHGRVVLLYFESCKAILGGSPATSTIHSGIESRNITEVESRSSKMHLLDAKLRSHKQEKLKRKLSVLLSVK
jgi:hypothetical protein